MKAKEMGLVWIVVKGFNKALKYYTEVVGLQLKEVNEEWGWAELVGSDGGMRLGIGKCDAQSPIQPGMNAVATFTIDNIEESRIKMLSQGAECLGEIQEVPGHVKMQTVRDQDGNIFQMVEVVTCSSC